MKKIIILIAILCTFSWCDLIIKIYNKNTSELVTTHKAKDCPDKMMLESHSHTYFLNNDGSLSLRDPHLRNNFSDFIIACTNGKKNKLISLYNASLFTYTIEDIKMTLK
jgi:hypothetical protein